MVVLLCWVSIMLNIMYAECHKLALYAECRYAECHYAKCRYAECHGSIKYTFWMNCISQIVIFLDKTKLQIKSQVSEIQSLNMKLMF